ncbi:MAG: SRPBCC family protein [Hyphomonadaceae bacterium]|nr:SRPBCC family protein [Hyphomonadaceae bacterium]
MTDHPNDLVISRYLAVPRAKLWRAWSDPALLAQWWCPKPWTTEVRGFDLRPGGIFHTIMRGPNPGEISGGDDDAGVFLEVVPMERIVFTSALAPGWRPVASWLVMTAVFTMADEGEGTRYVARCMHKDKADADKHAEMGFFDGWGTCVTQLEALAKTL